MRRKTSLGPATANAKRHRKKRAEIKNHSNTLSETDKAAAQCREIDRLQESANKRQQRLQADRIARQQRKEHETDHERRQRLLKDRCGHQARRAREVANLNRFAFTYDPSNFTVTSDIGEMIIECSGCRALKFKGETPGMCCCASKVILDAFPDPPNFLKNLIYGNDPHSKPFMEKIRYYNNCFQMTSFGQKEVRRGWSPTFIIQGQVYHRIGSLLPQTGKDPNFLQVYFLSTEDEINARTHNGLDVDILRGLTGMLHADNKYIQKLKYAKEILDEEQNSQNKKIVIQENKRPPQEHARRYNRPISDEVAILMDNEPTENRDIVIRLRDGDLQRVSELHPAYDTLQYPLLFPHGTDGYSIYLKGKNGRKITQLQFYSYHLQVRPENYLLRCGRLYQQLLVDWYCKMETERLNFIRREQKTIRAENYSLFRESLTVGDGDPANIGQKVILPATFTGGARYMHEKQADGMAYVRKFGCPDLFITVTCNPTWKEITHNLFPNQKPQDRPDITARVFREKLKKLMEMIKKNNIFGEVRAWLYSIEYQKRGLPHAHILVWLMPKYKIRPDDIDLAISAEIPDKDKDPVLHQLVMSHMIHGPCGQFNQNCVCMQDGKCARKFPKPYTEVTEVGQDSYPRYRRRSPEDGGHTGQKSTRHNTLDITNSWVVPYNPYLIRQFNCHLNVELCSSIKSIKYVMKYVHKGTDQAVFEVQQDLPPVDEIKLFQNARYVGSTEAVWRIFEFPIHEHHPPVVQLAVHLENGQRVYFTTENAQQKAADNPPPTTLTAFFKLCSKDHFAQTLTYPEVPEYYTWEKSRKTWIKRKRGRNVDGADDIVKTEAIGRMYGISPRQGECYFLRLLLNIVKGPVSFDNLKTYNGRVCASYRDAAQLHGLLEDDNHLDHAMEEVALSQSPKLLRDFFAIIITACEPSNPLNIWDHFKVNMAEDFLYKHRQEVNDENAQVTEDIYNQVLCHLEDKVLLIGGHALKEYGLPTPDRDTQQIRREYWREINYDQDQLALAAIEQETNLTADQKEVYTAFMTIVQQPMDATSNIMFLDAPGGTGKTYLINLILKKIRSTKQIAIATASSGIAATLLQGGRTLHSTFKIPLDAHKKDNATCSIKKGSAMAQVILDAAAIVVDEAPMTNKAAYEALDRTLQDIMNTDKPMGGIPVLFCGDFRQILPVVKDGTRADIVNASLKKSYIWASVIVKHLTTNMRAHLSRNTETSNFTKLLLDVGNGNIPKIHAPDIISIPQDLGGIASSLEDLKSKIFPNLQQNGSDANWLAERTILSPLNDTVNKLNASLMSEFSGEEKLYRSVDSAKTDQDAVLYPQEFLNSIELTGFPPHELRLKHGCPVIVLRSLEPPKTTNGTRCVIIRLYPNVIEAKISCGPYKGEIILIPRISLYPTDSALPFEFRRLQFPIKPAFSITINKSQGQTFQQVGIDLTQPCFTHGMFYVAASRTGCADKQIFWADDALTRNVVYPEAL